MALIHCKECGQSLSDTAPNCPHCGAPAAAANPPDLEAAARQEMRSALFALPIIIVVAYFVWDFFASDSSDTEQPAAKELSISENYPGSWQTDIRGDITKTLSTGNVRGCGVYVYKQSVNSSSEFLVYCSPDGAKDWTAYQVWPNINEIIGPMQTHPEIPPPAL